MKFNMPISAQERYFRIIGGEHLKIDHLRIDSSLAFHGKISSLEDFDSWWINARRDQISIVCGHAKSLAGNWIIQILDEINSGGVFFDFP